MEEVENKCEIGTFNEITRMLLLFAGRANPVFDRKPTKIRA